MSTAMETRVGWARWQAGLSAEEVAAAAGLPLETLTRLEAGELDPPKAMQDALMNAIEIRAAIHAKGWNSPAPTWPNAELFQRAYPTGELERTTTKLFGEAFEVTLFQYQAPDGTVTTHPLLVEVNSTSFEGSPSELLEQFEQIQADMAELLRFLREQGVATTDTLGGHSN